MFDSPNKELDITANKRWVPSPKWPLHIVSDPRNALCF